MGKTGAVIVAAGRSERMAGVEKMLAPLAGEPLLLHAVRPFQRSEAVDEIVIVTRKDLHDRVHDMVDREGLTKVRSIVRGGKTRCESSRHGVSALSPGVDVVLVHDGARPLVSAELIERVARAAPGGAVVPGVEPVATIKTAEHSACTGTIARETLREAQTPQGFRRDLLARAFAAAARERLPATDEATCVERVGEHVALVDGERRNVKITVPDDLLVAEALMAGSAVPRLTRIGIGRDAHRLVAGAPLVIGGVSIPFEKGLEGWSDADVLTHAVCDALLGAAAQGDLGDHFPPGDERWRDVTGAELLERTREILVRGGHVPVNVDATVTAEAPKLAPHRRAMVDVLAGALGVPSSRVSVKFTTTEGLGFEGRGEGISAECVALVARVPPAAESG